MSPRLRRTLKDGGAAARHADADQGVGNRPFTLATTSLALVCCMLWGGTVVAIRFSLDDLPPLGAAGIRFVLGALCMLGWCLWLGRPIRIQPREALPILVAGVLLFMQIALLNLGANLTNSAHATLFINTHPVFVAVIAHFYLVGDRLTRRKVGGLAVSASGMVLIVYLAGTAGNARNDPTPIGDWVVLASGALLGIKTVYIKHILPIVEPAKLLFWHDVVGVALFFGASFLFEDVDAYRFTVRSVLSLLYQGIVVAGFCFAAWTWLLRTHRASQLTVFAFATPIFGVLLSHWLRGNPIGLGLGVAGLAIAAGVYLVSTSGARP